MKYQVTAIVGISMHCVVEANSKEEAIEQAESAGMMNLCWSCAEAANGRNEHMNEWRTSGEFDGDPRDMNAEPVED